MIIKLPSNLKTSLYNTDQYYILKFMNKKGVIKKKIKNKEISIILKNHHLILSNPIIKEFNTNIISIYKIIIKQLIVNLYKYFRDRLLLEGIGYKV